MNKFAIVFLTAAMTLGSGAVMAANNDGLSNQAADAGAKAGGAKQNIAPGGVNNDKINNTGNDTNNSTMSNSDSNMSADQVHKNTQCKDGRCPDVNKKVGNDADTKTDGTTQ